MKVVDLWRFPVKSMQGERVPAAEVDVHGIHGDRHWAVLDVTTALVLTARRAPQLLHGRPLVGPAGVEVELPDGSRLTGDRELSDWLGRHVRLVEATGGRATYETPTDYDDEDRAPWTTWDGPAGSFHDSTRAALTLVSLPSLGPWDLRRFRQNVIVDGDGEDELVGRQIRIGSVVVDVRKHVDRCVVVTRAQPGIERDLDVLRDIDRAREGFLGVGGLVTAAGRIRIGDEVEVL